MVCAAIKQVGALNVMHGTCSFLCHVAKVGNNHMAKILLDQGADPGIADKDGWRPLHFAAERGSTDLVKELISSGADPEIQDKNDWRPIHVAAWNGHADTIKQLLSDGCNPEVTDKEGWQAIRFAAWKGHTDVVRSLVEAGANVHAATKLWSGIHEAQHVRPSGLYSLNEWTGQALHLAAMAASVPIISLLLNAGIDINACSNDLA